MRKALLLIIIFLSIFCAVKAQTTYKPVNNLITNSTFSSDINGWPSSPPNNAQNEGWRWNSSFTYGSALWIDRHGSTVASSNTMTLCPGYPKQVKFSFNSPNRGDFQMQVKLGGQLLGTFDNNGFSPRATFEAAEGVTYSILYNYFPSHYLTQSDWKIENNVWHDFIFTIPNYTGTASGSLTFEYTKTGLSRPIYIDNAEVYELIPTPVPTQTTVYPDSCRGTYNLTQLNPTDTKYTYTWYNSTDRVMTNEVPDPTKVGVGTYYLFARSSCTGTNNYSYPSAAVTVSPPEGCCGSGSNVIRDGTFSLTSPSEKPTGYLVPLNDGFSSKPGGDHWKRNYVGKDEDYHIVSSITFTNGTMTNALGMLNKSGHQHALAYQPNANIDRWTKKVIEFDFVSDTVFGSYPAQFAVYLKSYTGNWRKQWNSSTAFGPYIAEFTTNFSNQVALTGKPNGVTVKVNGVPATLNNYSYSTNTIYRITIEVPANFQNSGTDYFGGIAFWSDKYGSKYIDNVTVSASDPETPILTNSTVAVNCADGLADLTTLVTSSNITNYLPVLQYRWFTTNSSDGTMVPDPQKAPPGTYYLFAFSPTTGCYSPDGAMVTTTQNCPTISGTVYNDWDGSAIGGINNQQPVQNAMLYALLVNPTNNTVVKSMQLTPEGTFSFSGETNTQYYVMISDRTVSAGTVAPTAPAYPPASKPTGETINGTPDALVDGKSGTFTTGTGSSSVTTVNFGVNRIPVQDHITLDVCGVQQNIVLTSIESEPNWNEGFGKKMIINSITTLTNGTLTYDGATISTAPYTINAFDSTKLIFSKTDLSQIGKVEFEYAFEDAAGQSMLNVVTPPEPGKVSYTLNVLPIIADTTLNVKSGDTFNYMPKNAVNGNIIPSGTTYSWVRDTPVGVSGAESGTGTVSTGVTGTLTNSTTEEKTVIYTVTATAPNGCVTVFMITVKLKGIVNYWVGTPTSDDGTIPGNWSLNAVPVIGGNVEFATVENNGGVAAKNNLVIPSGTVMEFSDLTNETNFATIISAGASLTITNLIYGSDSDPSKLVVKAGNATQPNGSLIVANGCNMGIKGTVEFLAQGVETTAQTWTDNIIGSPDFGDDFTTKYKWQHFGIPVKEITHAIDYFEGAYVREYDETYNGDNLHFYHKWHNLSTWSRLDAFKCYEITHDAAGFPAGGKLYTFVGELNFCQHNLIMTRRAPKVVGASGANEYYGLGQNIFGNSYTSAIKISEMIMDAEVDETVYLYNTGRFYDWAETGTIVPDSTQLAAGNYLSIPKNTAEAVWGNQIPSMQGFLLKFVETSTYFNGPDVTVTLPYSTEALTRNTKRQLAPGAAGFQPTEKGTTGFQPVEKTQLSYLRINLQSQSTIDNLWLFSQEGTTEAYDNGWDGRKSFGTPTAFIYTETSAGAMQVNANHTIDGTPISFRGNGDSGYTLTLAKSNLDEYQDLHLLDLATKTVVPLQEDTTRYQFTSSNKGNVEKRFVIVNRRVSQEDFTNNEFTLLDGYITSDNIFTAINYTGRQGTMFLYNISGNLISSETLLTGLNIYRKTLNSGVYIMRLEAGSSQKSVKLIVNK